MTEPNLDAIKLLREAATTELESESASALCTKKLAPSVLNFNSRSRRSYKSKEVTTRREAS